MLVLVIKIFSSKKNWLLTCFFFCLSLFILFLFAEMQLILSTVTGQFPFFLFIAILPDLLKAFLFEVDFAILLNYILTAFLFSIYLTLLFEIFINKKYFSLLSIPSSLLSLAGISLSITCLSCGFAGGLLVLSLIGIGSSSFLFTLSNSFYMLMSQFLILISIIIVLYTIRKFEV